jgi:TPR repeat protein
VEDLKSLAERGNADAQFELGFMYGTGFCGLQDYAKAVYWYSQAAEKMHVVSQSILGWMYEEGRGVPQDYVQAHMYYNLASAQGHKPASKYREQLSKKMTESQITHAQKIAREWRPKK